VHYFLCEHSAGKIILSEHEDLKWVTKKELYSYRMAPGDAKIIEFLA